jgi:hypothetical protein
MAYNPKDGIKHIVHDYVYLVVSGTDTQRPLKNPFNHYAERTFLTHCRAVAKFLSAENDARDMYARDFTKTPFERKLPIWDKWSMHIDQHLMHLSKSRVENTVPWTGEPNKCMLEEFKAVWAAFLGELKSEMKPLFTEAMKEHQKAFKDYLL